MSTGRGLLSLPWGDAGGGGAAIGHDSNGRTVRYDVAGLLGAGPAVQALASNFAATAAAISAPTAAVQMAAEQRRLAAVTGIEPDMVMSPLAGTYWARDVGSISGDLAAWCAGMGGAFTRTSAATYFGPSGLMLPAAAGVPRFACDPVTGDRQGLLTEASETNSALRSNDISVPPWGLGPAASIAGPTVTAPDGTAAKVLVMSASANAFVSQGGITGVAGTTYTFSVWLMLVDGGDTLTTNHIALDVRDAGNAVSRATAEPVTLVKGLWRRVRVTATTQANGTMTIVPIYDHGGYQVAVWGAQVGVGSALTSNIVTTTAPVTRAGDYASIPLMEPSSFSTMAGTYLVEASVPAAPAGASSLVLDVGFQRGGTWANPGALARLRGQSGSLYAQHIALGASGELGRSEEVAVAAGAVVRMTATWGAGMRWSINGRVPTGIGSSPPASPTPIALFFASTMSAHLRRFAYWRTPLSDAQLQALSVTTW
ncbi:phage head spike fiber domain-containing protein [Segnochrobactrum spirostomi]